MDTKLDFSGTSNHDANASQSTSCEALWYCTSTQASRSVSSAAYAETRASMCFMSSQWSSRRTLKERRLPQPSDLRVSAPVSEFWPSAYLHIAMDFRALASARALLLLCSFEDNVALMTCETSAALEATNQHSGGTACVTFRCFGARDELQRRTCRVSTAERGPPAHS